MDQNYNLGVRSLIFPLTHLSKFYFRATLKVFEVSFVLDPLSQRLLSNNFEYFDFCYSSMKTTLEYIWIFEREIIWYKFNLWATFKFFKSKFCSWISSLMKITFKSKFCSWKLRLFSKIHKLFKWFMFY